MPKKENQLLQNTTNNTNMEQEEEEINTESSHITQTNNNNNQNRIELNVDTIENEMIEDHNKNIYNPEFYNISFLPQNELAEKLTLITKKFMLIKMKIKAARNNYEGSERIFIINKNWYNKWIDYSRYKTLKRILKNYELYSSKPIKYTPKEEKNPGMINNEDLMIRYKKNENDGRNILVSKYNDSLDTKKTMKNDIKILGKERFKLLNDFFKCDHILKGIKLEEKDRKSIKGLTMHLNICFLPTLSNYNEVKEENYEEFKNKHSTIYDIYFSQTASRSEVLNELTNIYKENPEILINMGIKFETEDKEKEILNIINHLKYYVPNDENKKTMKEILDFLLSKETIEKIKKEEKLKTDEINIKQIVRTYTILSSIFGVNWEYIKDNIDEVKNGFIFVEYVAPDPEEKKYNSIFEKKKISKTSSQHDEMAAYRENYMDIEHSPYNTPHQKRDYNLDEFPLDEKENKHGLVGLNNLGNTCYMNTGLQCLSNCELLTKYIIGKYYEKDINKNNPIGSQGEIVEKYAQLINHIWLGNKECLYPLQFKQAFGKTYQAFNDFRQQDTQEFISYLLDSLHEDLNKVLKKPYIQTKDIPNNLTDEEIFKIKKDLYLCRNQSFIADLIYGFYKSTVFCPNLDCKNISKSFEPFNMITLSLVNEAELRKIEEFKEEQNKIMGIRELNVFFIPFKINYKPLYFNVRIKKDWDINTFKKKIEIITGFFSNSFDIYKMRENKFIHMKSDITLLEDFLKGETRIYLFQIPPYVFGKELNFFDKIYEKLNSNMDKLYLEEEKYEGNDLYEEYNKKKENKEKKEDKEKRKDNEIKEENDIQRMEEEKKEDDDNNVDQNNININTNRNNNNINLENKNIPESQQSTKNNEGENDIEMEDKTFENIDIDKTIWIKAELFNYTYKFEPEEKEKKDQIKEERIALPRIIYINKNWNNAELYECILKILDGARNDMTEIKQMWFQDLKEITKNLEQINKLEKNNVYEQFNELNTQPIMLKYLDYFNYENEDKKNKGENTEDSVVIYDENDFLIKNTLEEAFKNNENNSENTGIIFKLIWKPNFASDYKEGIDPIIFEKSEKLEEIFKSLREDEYLKKNNIDKNEEKNKDKKEKKKLDLYELLNNFNQIEKLSKNNEWFCPKCQKHQLADKKMELYSISEVIIIHLKRFRNNRKIENLIDFPLENLDLNKYLPNQTEKYIYDLFAVANHVGGLHGGHYFAYCKNNIDGDWYEFNDSNVDKIDKNKIVTENAYVLFYKRKRDNDNKLNEEELFNKTFINIDYTKYE